MKAPPFTASTAAALGRKGGLASVEAKRKAREARRLLLLQAQIHNDPTGDEARRKRTLSQINAIDAMLDDALERGQHERALELVAAKDRLWKLVQPTAGALKPVRQRMLPRSELVPIPEPPAGDVPN